MLKDFKSFLDNFDIVDNALDMRNVIRWNGRPIKNRENLSEHTHLVVACALHLLKEFNDLCESYKKRYSLDYLRVIKACMLHDSLEILRGDILSITKDAIPGLRKQIDDEEKLFIDSNVGNLTDIECDLVKISDLMACYKFIERELKYPSNDFSNEVYLDTLKKFEIEHNKYLLKYFDITSEKKIGYPFCCAKGYIDDAGIDVIMQEDVIFMPMSTKMLSLNISIDVKNGEMAFLCSRTSASRKGLIVAMCPIDPNFKGTINAIVHNLSNDIIKYRSGESFCQLLKVDCKDAIDNYNVKKIGVRNRENLGSTGGVEI